MMSSQPARFKHNSKGPRVEANNGTLSPETKARAKSRSVLDNSSKPKSEGHLPCSISFNRPVVKPGRQRSKAEENSNKELQHKLELNNNRIRDLESQVFALKAELDKAHSLNEDLESSNKKMQQELASAEAKLAAFNKKDGPPSVPPRPTHLLSKVEKRASFAPPPPPPPPPMRPLSRATSAPTTPAIVDFYHSLKKQGESTNVQGRSNQHKQTVTSAHSCIVGEIKKRSAHLLAIKADVETKGDFINGLIEKVQAMAYTDIEDVLKFVDWLDGELSTLADERAVLKHFNWPERKADAIKEAAIEYRSLKQLESDISCFKDDVNITCATALKRMASLLDKSEQGIERLIGLRNSVLCLYRDLNIPTDWMLDSGMISKIKQASMKLAKMYMRRVKTELELSRSSDKENSQEALVLQGVHFAYRTHQFAGDLDSETICAIEEIRQRVPGHLGGSRELLVAIASS